MSKVVACLTFVVFLVERIGRRWALVIGAALMGSFMLIVAVLNKVYPPVKNPTSISSPAIATIIMIYMEAATYNMSWGPGKPRSNPLRKKLSLANFPYSLSIVAIPGRDLARSAP